MSHVEQFCCRARNGGGSACLGPVPCLASLSAVLRQLAFIFENNTFRSALLCLRPGKRKVSSVQGRSTAGQVQQALGVRCLAKPEGWRVPGTGMGSRSLGGGHLLGTWRWPCHCCLTLARGDQDVGCLGWGVGVCQVWVHCGHQQTWVAPKQGPEAWTDHERGTVRCGDLKQNRDMSEVSGTDASGDRGVRRLS